MEPFPREALRYRRFRFLNLPKPCVVEEDSSGPRSVRLENSRRQVTAILDRWRLTDHWWEGKQARNYFRLLLERDRQLTVFRDDATSEWYQQQA